MTRPARTTVALHTPPGRGGIAVLVLAGPEAERIALGGFRPRTAGAELPAGALRLGELFDERGRIDEALVCRRGDVVEVNLHGGPAAAAAAMRRLAALGAEVVDAPPAAPECFACAHRRWNNPAVGAELLAALSRARTPLAVRALGGQWSAGLSRLARRALEGLGAGRGERASPAEDLRAAAGRKAAFERLLTPAEVVLAGPPNVGKSTLANALVGRAVSIVHETPGTTRDWVRAETVLGGVGVFLTDTAGLWNAAGAVDAEAVRRARERIAAADVVLLLHTDRPAPPPAWLAGGHGPAVLRVAAQRDRFFPPAGPCDVAVSAQTGEGLDELAGRVVEVLALGGFDPAAAAAFTDRQVRLLRRAAEALDGARPAAAARALEELLTGPVGAGAAGRGG